MTPPEMLAPNRTRAARIANDLRLSILNGTFKPGARLPSESALTQQYSVSRTVVREAFAELRSEALVETRKGAGAFACDPAQSTQRPFSDLDVARLSSVIELFELRAAFEIRAAALAAQRRSGTEIDAMMRHNDQLATALAQGQSTREADFSFHLAIATASQNRRFPEFLILIRPGLTPRAELVTGTGPHRPYRPNPNIVSEHALILDAIIANDPDAAEVAMKAHLDGSLDRYRAIMRAL
ncbi:FadR/GntR family transcriptional regulator [Roseinatronobacter alkalisoli]|uniref:FadR/GntR family transcriptional regulator n=1 Tax=Roseinatronobacter alkalisoli TaxID=3028235 RepID=A0ABT5T8F5_9RHOB|nr:FadR/GntR family transcriptional regulator [Roseinatronobacter sp. HJB301]MDD7970985.1 FadR/GntR family transcriptional regulator [Roseinatronobacter sp. HJB301]